MESKSPRSRGGESTVKYPKGIEIKNGTKVEVEYKINIRIENVAGIKMKNSNEIRIGSGTDIESEIRIGIFIDRGRVRSQKQDPDWDQACPISTPNKVGDALTPSLRVSMGGVHRIGDNAIQTANSSSAEELRSDQLNMKYKDMNEPTQANLFITEDISVHVSDDDQCLIARILNEVKSIRVTVSRC
ncbi:hypothetical protein EVAR_24632_1 [Eumeta japonica]|uniref:Uncharacterized protein n=1 Tax=Eumeta variegata TaxID=151549 RepID=A0A4C1V108_EUMVA|nr:hypothetical protein EVAR_24632_1 [Eumeta japonica]